MQFINKRIAILGLGEEGRDLLSWLKKNSKNCNIKVFDKIKTANLTSFDIIFRSPGFYRLSPMMVKAEKTGAKILSATKLFFDLSPAKIIGVTGTKGKGTTSALITQILKAGGNKVKLAGNIGESPLKLIKNLKPSDWVVLELSSFQLQDLTVGPKIAVVLNVTREHLDVHRSTGEYRRSKQNILRYQASQDKAVLNADYAVTKSWSRLTQGKVYWFSRRHPVKGSYVLNGKISLNLTNKSAVVGLTKKLLLRGEHNWENVTAAITASALAGAKLPDIKKAVFSFKGLEHRLELVKSAKGVKFYNDSFSTTPETAMAAIKSFAEPMTLILGGSEKGSNYRQLGKLIVKSPQVKTLILVGRTANQIQKAVNRAGKFKGTMIKGLTSMKAIVASAFKKSLPGEVVVLSPACASFDMFINYQDRGEQFKAAVKKL